MSALFGRAIYHFEHAGLSRKHRKRLLELVAICDVVLRDGKKKVSAYLVSEDVVLATRFLWDRLSVQEREKLEKEAAAYVARYHARVAELNKGVGSRHKNRKKKTAKKK